MYIELREEEREKKQTDQQESEVKERDKATTLASKLNMKRVSSKRVSVCVCV